MLSVVNYVKFEELNCAKINPVFFRVVSSSCYWVKLLNGKVSLIITVYGKYAMNLFNLSRKYGALKGIFMSQVWNY